MDTNMTFRMDSKIKAQMAEICEQLGISISAAFNLFAHAFVRNQGMPFPVTLQTSPVAMPRTKMLSDAGKILDSFAEDYKRMAE